MEEHRDLSSSSGLGLQGQFLQHQDAAAAEPNTSDSTMLTPFQPAAPTT